MPAPKLLTSLPVASNFMTGSRGENAPFAASQQRELPLQRSATQIDLPSLSTSTALSDPHTRPSGSFAHPSIVWYGLGKSFTGCVAVWPAATTSAAVTSTRTETKETNLERAGSAMSGSLMFEWI